VRISAADRSEAALENGAVVVKSACVIWRAARQRAEGRRARRRRHVRARSAARSGAYSAAGNSADELWYELGIFGWDFEVRNSLWNAQTRQWEDAVFQPPFDEGHDEALEYASGVLAMIGVAAADRRR
jgi:hypothetical protein